MVELTITTLTYTTVGVTGVYLLFSRWFNRGGSNIAQLQLPVSHRSSFNDPVGPELLSSLLEAQWALALGPREAGMGSERIVLPQGDDPKIWESGSIEGSSLRTY